MAVTMHVKQQLGTDLWLHRIHTKAGPYEDYPILMQLALTATGAVEIIELNPYHLAVILPDGMMSDDDKLFTSRGEVINKGCCNGGMHERIYRLYGSGPVAKLEVLTRMPSDQEKLHIKRLSEHEFQIRSMKAVEGAVYIWQPVSPATIGGSAVGD